VRLQVITRQALTTLLVLSLWHAPVPWVHAHDLVGPVVDHVPALHRHVDEFHATEVEHGDEHLDLHAHWILPWQRAHDPVQAPGHPGGDSSDDDGFLFRVAGAATGPTLKSVGQPAGRSFDGLSPALGMSVRQRLPFGNAPAFALSHGRHFFETYGRAVSVGDLLGVRVC
jgi:hypothetical protein